jgi:predicted component of type VI protein secretion system
LATPRALTAIALQAGQSLWNEALDALFRSDFLATHLLATHAGAPTAFQLLVRGLSPQALSRAFKESTGLSPHN